MIDCIPRGSLSWDYDLSGMGHTGATEFDAMEDGFVTVDGQPYEVRKHGAFSWDWTLEAHSSVIHLAQKTLALARTFEIQTTAGVVTLRTWSGRTMALTGGGFDAVIAPIRPLTHQATIKGEIPDFRTACFAFWLATLSWRRTAKGRASG